MEQAQASIIKQQLILERIRAVRAAQTMERSHRLLKFGDDSTVYETHLHHVIKPGEENRQIEWIIQLEKKRQLTNLWLFAVVEGGCYVHDPHSSGLGWCFNPTTGKLIDQLMGEGLVGRFDPSLWTANDTLTIKFHFIIYSGTLVVPQISIGEESFALPTQVISPASELYFITGTPALTGQKFLTPSSILQIHVGPTNLHDTQVIIPRGSRYETVMDEMHRMEIKGHTLFMKPVAAQPFPKSKKSSLKKTTTKIYINQNHRV